MKIKIENPYWPNAVGFAAAMFAIAIFVQCCSNVLIEQEKTKQIQKQTQVAP